MGIFSKGNRGSGGFMDEIRCDEPSYLIWKWHPAGAQAGGSNRENAIRFGSSLRVKDGEAAVFVYKQKSGTMEDFIVGPYDQMIKTANFPVLASIIGRAYDGGTPFQAEIYFINLARVVQVRFGVPFFDVFDPRFSDFGVPVAVRGTISFQIQDYRKFIKLNRLNTFDLEDFQKQVRDAVCRYVKDAVANAPAANDIPVVQIETKIAQINDVVEYDLRERLAEDFGVYVSGVDLGTIEVDKASDGYRQLMAITRDVASTRIEAETRDYVERLRIQREESQYAARKQAQSANLSAFHLEKSAEIGVAGAQALGQIGASGSGNINLGGSGGDGFNLTAMMASMAVGSAVGKNIAGTIDDILNGPGAGAQSGVVPPPIPTAAYYVAVNGHPTGPFDLSALAQMAVSGELTPSSLVWTRGMAQWQACGTLDTLKGVFANIMPPIPPETDVQ